MVLKEFVLVGVISPHFDLGSLILSYLGLIRGMTLASDEFVQG